VVRRILLYFEGAKPLREAFHVFLAPLIGAARARHMSLRLVSGGDTISTLTKFAIALETETDAIALVLIDSDSPKTVDDSPVDFVSQRWHVAVPEGVREDQIQFMVQVMEAWFLAQKEKLAAYYGTGFSRSALPGNPHVEEVPKSDVLNGLSQATRHTQKGCYHKVRDAVPLLSDLDPGRVREAAPHCDRLLATLERLVDGSVS